MSSPRTELAAATELETPDGDNHGKLAHLNAVDLRALTLARRYVYVTLLHPPNSDELGRFMTHSGANPLLPALSDKAARGGDQRTFDQGLLRIWSHGASTCWELTGAYAFKPDKKRLLYDRRLIAKQKRDEAFKRRQRKKDADEGVPFVYEDDGTQTEGGKIHEKIRTQRGNLVPTRPGIWFNSKVPPPRGQSRYKMLIEQPATSEGCVLRMLPSFNPGENLSELGAVLRFYLLMECDDYGRVSVDSRRLYQQLGPVITKRISMAKIEHELHTMEKLGHLMVFGKPRGKFGYLKDSAQHLLKKKTYSHDVPRLLDAWNFTYDSEEYTDFFEACAKHSATRAKVHVGSYSERGDIHAISEYVEVAAKRFVESHERLMAEEPYRSLSPEQIMGREAGLDSFQCLPYSDIFWYAVANNQPAEWLEHHYLVHREELDCNDGRSAGAKYHNIFTYLLGMTPAEFVEKAKTDEARPPFGIVP